MSQSDTDKNPNHKNTCDFGVPCPDSLHINGVFQTCIIQSLKKQCSHFLTGSWINPDNFTVVEYQSCGLSNYLFFGSLKDAVPTINNEPRCVLIRLYGEVLRDNTSSILSDSISFALLSEKRMGPKLHAIFPGGRIEEYIESRTLKTNELPKPEVMSVVAKQMANFHKLHMPFSKKPPVAFKMLDKFLGQLTGSLNRPCRPSTELSIGSMEELKLESKDNVSLNTRNHELETSIFEKAKAFVEQYEMIKEFKWLQNRLQSFGESFPVVFCHNDMQENNILVLNNPELEKIYRILPIDFEYSGYNYRCFDLGNHFNEWCYDYSNPDAPYFYYNHKNFPTRSQQNEFWKIYLDEYYSPALDNKDISCVDNGSTGVGSIDKHSTNGEGILQPDFDALHFETIYGALLSHLLWSAWSLIQSQLSNIKFDFMAYAIVRMKFYKEMKQLLPLCHRLDDTQSR